MNYITRDIRHLLGMGLVTPFVDDQPKREWVPPTYTDEERKKLVRGGDTPIALLPLRGRESWPWPAAVRSGVLCLLHDDWDYLVWDGERLLPRCCVPS